MKEARERGLKEKRTESREGNELARSRFLSFFLLQRSWTRLIELFSRPYQSWYRGACVLGSQSRFCSGEEAVELELSGGEEG